MSEMYDSETLRKLAKKSGLKTKALAEQVCVTAETMQKFIGGRAELGNPAKKLLWLVLTKKVAS